MYKNNGMDKTYNNNKPKEVFKNFDKKPPRYSTDSFVKELITKKIRICLINGDIFEGILNELGMFDIKIAINTEDKTIIAGKEMSRNVVKDRIFMKSGILWIEVQ